MIMNISAFSFIGLTLGDDVIDWGSMLSGGAKYADDPSIVAFPADTIYFPVYLGL